MTTKRDYYDILGVNKTAPEADIKKAYRKKALEFHPDQNKSADAETKFKEVNEAYEILSSPQKKKTYDQFGHAAFDPSAGAGGPFGNAGGGRSGPFQYTYQASGPGSANTDGFSDPFDIFENIFGGANPFQRGPQKPHYSLRITFMEAAKGVEKTFVHQGKQYKVKVPAGASDGTRIRYAEFDVSFDVQPHDTFKRDGYDLFVDYDLPLTTAILGGKIKVPTLHTKDITIKIRPGTQPGTMVRLVGKGVKRLGASSHGDLYVRLKVMVPEKLTRKQKEIIEKFGDSLSS